MLEILKEHLPHIIDLILITIVVGLLFKLIEFFDKQITEKVIKQGKNTKLLKFSPVLSKILKAVILFCAFATFLQNHGYSITSLIAGFGITGLAVGFAAKETIANLFGSISIIYDDVYDIGDYVQIDSVEGTVQDINLRSTKIKSLDNVLTTIPNNIVANAIVKNYSEINSRLINQTVGVTYDTSIDEVNHAMDIIKEILNNHENILENPQVYISELADYSVNIAIMAYMNKADVLSYKQVKDEILREIYRRFNENKIDFAFPSQTLYIAKNNEN